jgi:hypothetical protein
MPRLFYYLRSCTFHLILYMLSPIYLWHLYSCKYMHVPRVPLTNNLNLKNLYKLDLINGFILNVYVYSHCLLLDSVSSLGLVLFHFGIFWWGRCPLFFVVVLQPVYKDNIITCVQQQHYNMCTTTTLQPVYKDNITTCV